MSLLLAVIVLASAGYLCAAWVFVGRFARRELPEQRGEWPSVSIVKPLYGDEPDLAENLRSFCEQDYPDYEIVFALHDRADPALAAVEEAIAEAPNCRVRVVFGENPARANPKIANIAKAGVASDAAIVIVSDSDIRVGPEYLRSVVASFSDPNVGAVTCLYGGIPNDTLASRLGALHVEDEFSPSVLVALGMGPLQFCLGATMAVRRSVLEAIGGFGALGDRLADDHALGRLVAEAGYEVALSRYVVGTTNPERHLRELWLHELRWARTNRALAPIGYAFAFVMYALPFAFWYAFAGPEPLGAALLLLIAVLRGALHVRARAVFGNRHDGDPLLVPLRDTLSLLEWVASYFGRSVRWRGATMTSGPERR